MKLLKNNGVTNQIVAHALDSVAVYNNGIIKSYTKNPSANSLLELPTTYSIANVVKLKSSPGGKALAAQTFSQTIRCMGGVQTPFSTVGHFDVHDSGLMVVSDYMNNAVQLITDSVTNITANLGADDRVVVGRTKYVIYSPVRILTALFTDVVFVETTPAKEIIHVMHVGNDEFAVFYKDGTATYKNVTRQTNIPFMGHREQGQHLTLTDYKNDYVVNRKTPLTSPYVLRPFKHTLARAMTEAEWDKLLLHIPGNSLLSATADIKNALGVLSTTAVTVVDESPYGNTGKSFSFDGVTSTFQTADSVDIQLGSADFTLEFFVFVTTAGEAVATILNKGGLEGGFAAYTIVANPDKTFSFQASTSGTSYDVGNTSWGKWEVGVWTHIAISRQSNNWRCFQDGQLRAKYTKTGSLITAAGRGLTLGHSRRQDYTTGTPVSMFAGKINGLVIHNYAKYTANFFVQPAALKKTTARPSDLTPFVWSQFRFAGNEAIEDVMETPLLLTNASITNGRLVNTDATTAPMDKARPLYITENEDFSIEGCFNFTSITSYGGSILTMDMLGTGGTGNQQFALTILQDLSVMFFLTPTGNGSSYQITVGAPKIVLGTDYHVAVCRVGGVLSIYLNGTEVYSAPNVIAGFRSTEFLNVRRGAIGTRWNMRVLRGLSAYDGNFIPVATLPTLTQNIYPADIETDILVQACMRKNALVNERNGAAINLAGSASVVYGRILTTPANSSRFSMACGYFGAADFTLECLVRLPVAPAQSDSAIFGQYLVSTKTGNSWQLSLNTDGTMRLYMFLQANNGQGGGSPLITSSLKITRNTDAHVVIERVGAVVTLYLDGVPAGTATLSGPVFDASATIPLRNFWESTASANTLNITNIRIAKRAMYNGVIPMKASLPKCAMVQ